MVVHVADRARLATRVDRVVVATDDARVAEAVRSYGHEAWMTSEACAAGSDRVAEVASGLSAEIVVNVQGDEPLIDPGTLDAVIAAMVDPAVQVATAAAPLHADEALDPSRVKVVCDPTGRALYFSRAPIPHGGPWWIHLGIYAFRREALLRFAALAPSPLEGVERLEQLRLLENGVPIQVVPVPRPAQAVDTPEDLLRVRAIFGDFLDLSSPT